MPSTYPLTVSHFPELYSLTADLIVLPQHPEPHRSELVLLVIEFQPPVRKNGKLAWQWETFLKPAELHLTGS